MPGAQSAVSSKQNPAFIDFPRGCVFSPDSTQPPGA
jgi:hypothetical protein